MKSHATHRFGYDDPVDFLRRNYDGDAVETTRQYSAIRRYRKSSRASRIILVTSFEPFGGELLNPSQMVLEKLPEFIGGTESKKCCFRLNSSGQGSSRP